MFAFVFDESLFAFAYETPPNAFALLFDRTDGGLDGFPVWTDQCRGDAVAEIP